ncbi:hypothetical protein M2T36_25205, partial [Escherichia coli]|nr:hypothetical protein [Escherichia coli]
PSNGYKFFGFDVENDYIAGFESGAWGENFCCQLITLNRLPSHLAQM